MPHLKPTIILSFNLKLLRLERGLTQNDIAKMSKMTVRTYQSIEAGSANPTLSTIQALSNALEITSSRLISLDYFRLNQEINEFTKKFSEKFEKLDIAINIRTLDGKIIYRNDKFKQTISFPAERDGSVDLLKLLPNGAKEILRCQMASERSGLATPYVNFGNYTKTNERLYFRFYPCLILPLKGRSPILTAVYATEITEDSYKNYFKFCNYLISCIKK